MQAIVRFLMLLSLGLWIGGIVFFAAVLAPTVFMVLPSRTLAGVVVSRSLFLLHVIGLVSGVLFLVTSMIHARMANVPMFDARQILIILMLALVIYSQWGIGAKMNHLRTDMGEIDRISHDDPRRVEFNALHHWSTRLEGSVLVLGLAVLYLTSRRLGGS